MKVRLISLIVAIVAFYGMFYALEVAWTRIDTPWISCPTSILVILGGLLATALGVYGVCTGFKEDA